jgi:DivIVA domain-containing protein
MTFAPDDIEIKEFVPTLRGYDRTEVRAFLRAVAEDVRRLEDRLAERTEHGVAPSAPVGKASSLDPSTSTSLEDAIRSLTVAVESLSRTGTSRVVTEEVIKPAVLKPVEPVIVKPVIVKPVELIATTPVITAPVNKPVVIEHVEPEITKPSDSPMSDVVPQTSKAANSTWDGVERRSARRPWSGRGSNSSTGTSAPREPAHLRAAANDSLISKFLRQALDHRERPAESETSVGTINESNKTIEANESIETNASKSGAATNNVVPLMRAVS